MTPAGSLVLSRTSSNPGLIPLSGIVFGGSGASRTVKAFPAANMIGSAVVTVTATDANGGMAHEDFNVTVTATASQTWRLTHFGIANATGDAADLADPEFDGLLNLLEFALAGDPHAPSAPSLPGVTRVGGNLLVTYTRSKAALADGILFAVEMAVTPGGAWTTAGVSEVILSEDASVQRMQATVGNGAESERFVRLRVTRP